MNRSSFTRALLYTSIVVATTSAAAAPACPSSVSIANATDFVSTVRVPAYPEGTPTASADACCVVCAAAPGCVAWVWEVREVTCFPVSSYVGSVHNADRVSAIMSPPPPFPVPTPWAAAVAAGDRLFAERGDAGLPAGFLPMIGNGFVAGQLMADAVYCAGIFAGQGLEAGSHRARIPAPHAIPAPGAPGPAALDVREATYYRRSTLAPSGAPCRADSPVSCVNALGNVTVEQRWYAHRAIPSLLIMEVSVAPDASAAPSGAEPYALLHLVNGGGAPTRDIDLQPVAVPPDAPYTATAGATVGTECPPGACGDVVTTVFNVLVLSSTLPGGVLAVPAAAPFATTALVTVVRTSIETAGGVPALLAGATADFAAAAAAAANGTLHASHVAGAWRPP